MQSLDVFMSRLLPLVPGCPYPTAEQALLDSAIEFCEETQAVQVVTDPVALYPDQQTYTITLPLNTEIARVIKIWSGTRLLTQVEPVLVDTPLVYNNPTGTEYAATGNPRIASVVEDGTVTLYPTPNIAAASAEMLTVRVAIKPTRSATQVSDSLYTTWAEAIVAGAAFRLAGIPGTAFGDSALTTESHSRFRYFINRARIEANRGRLVGPAAVRMKPFA